MLRISRLRTDLLMQDYDPSYSGGMNQEDLKFKASLRDKGEVKASLGTLMRYSARR